MSDFSGIARSLAQTGGTKRLVITDDSIVQKSGGFWRPSGSKEENRAQFEKFRSILEKDYNLATEPGAAEIAFAAIRKEAEAGKPLTARLIAKALQAGDAAVERFQTERAEHREAVLQKAMTLARSGDLIDLAVREATGGVISNVTRTASPQALKEIRATVIGELRKLVAEHDEAGTMPSLRLPDIDGLIRTAVVRHADRIAELAIMPSTDFVDLARAPVTERLKPTLDLIAEVAQRRQTASMFASAGANAQFEQLVLRDMEVRLQVLDNRALLDLYRTSLSADMTEFRLLLANRPDDPVAQRALADLNSWEGMVHMAVAERSIVPRGAPQLEEIGGRQLQTLAHVEKRSAGRELVAQTDEWLRGEDGATRTEDPRATASLHGKGVTVAEVGKLLREAPLTINLWGTLFSPGGPFVGKDGKPLGDEARVKNLFELPIDTKGPDYYERRQMIEHAELPTLERQDRDGVVGGDHPISAALNPGRNLVGGGFKGGYGDCFLVLKDSVKERATYTPTDSFFAYEVRLTRENVDALKLDLARLAREGHPGLSESALEALRKEPSEALKTLLERLEARIGTAYGLGHPTSVESLVGDELIAGIEGFTPPDGEPILNLALRHLIDRSPGSNHVASFERLAQVIGGVNGNADGFDMVGALATAQQDPKRVNLALGGYVEAQIFGGVDMRRDVEEIRYNPQTMSKQARQGLLAFAKENGIKATPIDLTRDREVTRLGTDESIVASFDDTPEEVTQRQVKSLGEFRAKVMPEAMEAYESHEETFDPTGIHGRRHIGRSLIYANALANLFRERGAEVNADVLYGAVAFHDSGRQGNGTDIWEKDSAKKLRQHYEGRGIDDHDFLRKAEACIDSQADGRVKTLEGAILKSVDSLDIMRVYGREGYRTDLLWFMNTDSRVGEELYVEADHGLRDALLDEIALFIAATEPRTPGDAEYERLDMEFIKAASDPLRKGEVEDLRQRREEARQQRDDEHRKLNSEQTGEQVFASLEKELLANPQKYPILTKYYDPTG